MAGRKGRIVVAGNINMDIFAEAERLPGAGEYVYGKALQFIPGGNGLNQAIAARRLEADIDLVGFVGDDGIGKEILWFLNQEDLKTENIKVLKGTHTGSVLYLLAERVERHVVLPGCNLKCKAKDLPYLEFNESDIVVSQLTISQDVIEHVFKNAKKSDATTIINLFPEYEVSKRLMMLSDFIVLNEVELAFRTGDKEYKMAHYKDLQMDPGTILKRAEKLKVRDDQVVIVTLADRGVVGIANGQITQIKGIKVKFADATGAGDCFIGAFATALSEEMDFKESLEFANCAAALSVQKVGTTTSFPRRNEVNPLFKNSTLDNL